MAKNEKPTFEVIGPAKDYGDIPNLGELKINKAEFDRQAKLERFWFIVRIGIALTGMCMFTAIFGAILLSLR